MEDFWNKQKQCSKIRIVYDYHYAHVINVNCIVNYVALVAYVLGTAAVTAKNWIGQAQN